MCPFDHRLLLNFRSSIKKYTCKLLYSVFVKNFAANCARLYVIKRIKKYWMASSLVPNLFFFNIFCLFSKRNTKHIHIRIHLCSPPPLFVIAFRSILDINRSNNEIRRNEKRSSKRKRKKKFLIITKNLPFEIRNFFIKKRQTDLFVANLRREARVCSTSLMNETNDAA